MIYLKHGCSVVPLKSYTSESKLDWSSGPGLSTLDLRDFY